MNRYLLDTHILLWWLYDDPKLSEAHKTVIANPENSIYVSAASIWEIEIKRNLGKLTVDETYLQAIEEDGFIMLDIKAEHPMQLRSLPDIHHDPFDRMLIAQSMCEKLTLLSADSRIKQYQIEVI